MSEAVISARGLRFRYRHAAVDAIAGIDIDIAAGEFVALLGPNGSGKSTLLRLLLGALEPAAGATAYDGKPLAAWGRSELARRIGVVTQSEEVAFPIAVRDYVAMGRYPHLGPWRRERETDAAAIASAMHRCEVAHLGQRSLLELSGGERQRVRLARALAQEPGTLMLDEPTAALDIAHEMALFEMLAGLSHDGATVVVVTHNINLAARYAGRLVLLDCGRIAADGTAAAVLTRSLLEQVYHWPVHIRHEGTAPQVVPARRTNERHITRYQSSLQEEFDAE